jgi:murein DD-endopeptidase MepM/ murein hydrolase activator NlpD
MLFSSAFLCLPAVILASACAAQSDPRLEGDWLGRLGDSEINAGVLCSFRSNGEHALSGTMLTGFAGATLELDDLKVEAGKVTFAVKEYGGTFQGSFVAGGARIEGSWTQRGVSHPLWMVRTPAHPWGGQPGILLSIKKPPAAVHAGGKQFIAYELHVTNWSGLEMTLRRIEIVFGDKTGVFEGDAIEKRTIAGGVHVGPWTTSVVLLEGADDSIPAALNHRVTVEFSNNQSVTEETGRVPVSRDVVRFGPPLAGGPWRATAGPGSRHHRGTLVPVKGALYLSQRFAFDFSLPNSPALMQPVLAVADAKVISVLDGVPDNAPRELLPAVKLTAENGCGNYITLDLGQSRYATYCHLHAGIRVRPGDQVRAGQVIGAVGNSGGSFGAHLHFQITDGPDPNASEGIPFEFRSFTHDGVAVENEMPLDEWKIGFPPLPQAGGKR